MKKEKKIPTKEISVPVVGIGVRHDVADGVVALGDEQVGVEMVLSVGLVVVLFKEIVGREILREHDASLADFMEWVGQHWTQGTTEPVRTHFGEEAKKKTKTL